MAALSGGVAAGGINQRSVIKREKIMAAQHGAA